MDLGADGAQEPEPLPSCAATPSPIIYVQKFTLSFPNFNKGRLKLPSMILKAFCSISSTTWLVHLSLSLSMCQSQNAALNIFFLLRFCSLIFFFLKSPHTPLCLLMSCSLLSAQTHLFSEASLSVFSSVRFVPFSLCVLLLVSASDVGSWMVVLCISLFSNRSLSIVVYTLLISKTASYSRYSVIVE